MKTEYRYIRFVAAPEQSRGNKRAWYCVNKKHESRLALVFWYAPWRQYVINPSGEAVFSADCLNDIADFLKQVNSQHQ